MSDATEPIRRERLLEFQGSFHAISLSPHNHQGRHATRLRELVPNQGTDFYNRHPILQMWINKLCDLSGADKFRDLQQGLR